MKRSGKEERRKEGKRKNKERNGKSAREERKKRKKEKTESLAKLVAQSISIRYQHKKCRLKEEDTKWKKEWKEKARERKEMKE